MNEAEREAFEKYAQESIYGSRTKEKLIAGLAWQAALEWQRSQCEPFGYFKCELDGWIDCAETDDGAIALYEAPPTAQINDQMREALQEFDDAFCEFEPALKSSRMRMRNALIKARAALAAATPK